MSELEKAFKRAGIVSLEDKVYVLDRYMGGDTYLGTDNINLQYELLVEMYNSKSWEYALKCKELANKM